MSKILDLTEEQEASISALPEIDLGYVTVNHESDWEPVCLPTTAGDVTLSPRQAARLAFDLLEFALDQNERYYAVFSAAMGSGQTDIDDEGLSWWQLEVKAVLDRLRETPFCGRDDAPIPDDVKPLVPVGPAPWFGFRAGDDDGEEN